MRTYRIGEISSKLELSVDTLRYYEKIGLLPSIARNPAQIRLYTDRDISRLKFIRRAQKMNFSLAEIGELLHFRDDPVTAKPYVRKLIVTKLSEIDHQLDALQALRNELKPLLNQCEEQMNCCPIIENISQ